MSLLTELIALLLREIKDGKNNKDRLDKKQNDEFSRLGANAVNRTLSYLNDKGNEDIATEKELSDLWTAVACVAKPFDPDLARRCYEKGNYWADPSRWSEEEIKEAGIGIKRIQKEIGDYFDGTASEKKINKTDISQGKSTGQGEHNPDSLPAITSSKPWYKNAIAKTVALIFLLAAITTIAVNLEKILERISPSKHIQQIKDDSEIVKVDFSPITHKGFFDKISDDNLTDLQKDQFLKQHLGRKVEWEGFVQRVDNGTDSEGFEHVVYITPILNMNSKFDMTGCWFSAKHKRDLLALEKGQRAVVSGILKDYDRLGVRLVYCELKMVESSPQNTRQTKGNLEN